MLHGGTKRRVLLICSEDILYKEPVTSYFAVILNTFDTRVLFFLALLSPINPPKAHKSINDLKLFNF